MKAKDEEKLDSIAENLWSTFHFFRRISKGDVPSTMRSFDPSRVVLITVMKHGPLPVSEIDRRIDISKPYMTALIDKLIKEGLVERIPDKADRRTSRSWH
jgi:DNA-binding transcriptional ArsR family regulator